MGGRCMYILNSAQHGTVASMHGASHEPGTAPKEDLHGTCRYDTIRHGTRRDGLEGSRARLTTTGGGGVEVER